VEKTTGKRKGLNKTNNTEKIVLHNVNNNSTTKLNTTSIRKKYNFKNGEVASIWNEEECYIEERKIFCFCENMVGADLPINSKTF